MASDTREPKIGSDDMQGLAPSAVSVIVTSLTDAEQPYLEAAIRSVLNQKHVVEILVGLRDGSSVFEEIISRYDSVRFIRFPLLPVGVVRNMLVLQATGEWVAFLDGDDIWCDGKIEAQLGFAKRSKLDFVGTDHLLVSEENVACARNISINVAMPSSWLVRREIMLTHRFGDPHTGSDINWWRDHSGLIRAGRLPLPLLRYRVRRVSLSTAKASKRNKLLVAKTASIPLVRPLVLGGTWLLNRLRRSERYVWNVRDWGPAPVRSK